MKKQQKKMVDAAPTTTTTTTIGTNPSTAKAGVAGPRNKIKKSTTATKHGQAEVVAAVAELAAEEEKMMSGGGGGGVEVGYFGGDQAEVEAAEVDRAEDWRTWVRPEGLVDEQMSWGAVWYSFWEVDGSENCHAFYGDVLEEDDIWDLRSIKHAPA